MSGRLYRLNARPPQPQGPLASRGLDCWAWALALALVSALAWVLAMLGTSQKRPGPGRSRTCLLGLIVGDGDGGREGDRWVSTDPGTNASDCGSGSRGASRLELAERATRESGAAGPAKQGAEPGRRHRHRPRHQRQRLRQRVTRRLSTGTCRTCNEGEWCSGTREARSGARPPTSFRSPAQPPPATGRAQDPPLPEPSGPVTGRAQDPPLSEPSTPRIQSNSVPSRSPAEQQLKTRGVRCDWPHNRARDIVL
jgi:hypothetical protein